MSMSISGFSRSLACCFTILLASASFALAQDPISDQPQVATQRPTRSVAAGEKMKLKGTIVTRDADSFVMRDQSGAETRVELTGSTSVKSKGGFLRRGNNYEVTNLLRGLFIEVEERGNSAGNLEATKIRFDRDDLQVAQSIDTRVSPVESRVDQVEAENRSLAGQVDELNEVSKVIRSDVDRANAGVDAANNRITATNDRISSLDDYDVQDQATVLFKVNSAVLSEEAKTELDAIAQKAMAQKGYVIEIAGFTDSTGSVQKNRALSERRADAVVRYLQENHDIPLRRMITPFGYGEAKPVADNDTPEARKQNRRVEVKILVSRGLTQQSSM